MLKCTETHVRQCGNKNIFPGVLSPDPRVRGGEGRADFVTPTAFFPILTLTILYKTKMIKEKLNKN